MGAVYSEADSAAALELGYCRRPSHDDGPLNDAAVCVNPCKKKNGLDTPAKKSVQTVEETPTKEMLPMQHTTNYPAIERELVDSLETQDVTVPRPLEVPGSVPTPPAGFTPDYFVNEFAAEPVPEYSGHTAPAIERPGYRLQRSWNPEDGLGVWIDHLTEDPFTVPEIRDLITTLTGALDSVTDGAPSTEAPEGFVQPMDALVPTEPAGYFDGPFEVGEGWRIETTFTPEDGVTLELQDPECFVITLTATQALAAGTALTKLASRYAGKAATPTEGVQPGAAEALPGGKN